MKGETDMIDNESNTSVSAVELVHFGVHNSDGEGHWYDRQWK